MSWLRAQARFRATTASVVIAGLLVFLHACAADGRREARNEATPHPVAAADAHSAHEHAAPAPSASGSEPCAGDCADPSPDSSCPRMSVCCQAWFPAIARYALASPPSILAFHPVALVADHATAPDPPALPARYGALPGDSPPRFEIVARPVLDRAPPRLA